MTLLHATCISIEGLGVLLRGASGAGKSDLALQLIDGGARLVADDYCELSRYGSVLTARAPANIAGKMEVRGHGIIDMPFVTNIAVALVVDLMPVDQIPRLPETTTCTIDEITLPLVCIDPSQPSAAARVRLAMQRAAKPRRIGGS
jgi:serine kinase of HPr protein (carbohydrate metabolism regulator)